MLINDLNVTEELLIDFPRISATIWCQWPGLRSGGVGESGGTKNFFPWLMDTMQQETGDQVEPGHRKFDFENPTDDDEVTLPPHDRATEVPDFLDTDIRDRQTLFDTQQEDWLMQTEPLHGARPRQPGRERPPVIDDRPLLGAAGGVAGRKPDQAPLLSPGRQILLEEVKTPPRGGRPAVETQGLPPRGGRPARASVFTTQGASSTYIFYRGPCMG